MYSTCLFCQASLGKNEAIEHFQVGRRLAFDADKGRLWVVCRKCQRWNLTPLEERWEAIEECEREFSSTRLRVSTDNVGFARVKEGLELVRIGKPQRPEFAAWRYGDQFRRRQRNYLLMTGALGIVAAGHYLAGPVFGVAAGSALGVLGALNFSAMGVNMFHHHRVRGRVAVPGEQQPAAVRFSQIEKISIMSEGDRWRIRMPLDGAHLTGDRRRLVTIEGDAALRAAATILAVSNQAGANKKRLAEAVDIVSATPDASRLFLQATRESWKVDPELNRWVPQAGQTTAPAVASLNNIKAEMLLALEMATNEDIERRAMEGELAMLEAAWRQAEEIAAIADNIELGKPGDISARSES
jgi:hypothetical protein